MRQELGSRVFPVTERAAILHGKLQVAGRTPSAAAGAVRTGTHWSQDKTSFVLRTAARSRALPCEFVAARPERS